MDVDALTTFAAVARCGGIGRAALQLHTVQSNVTTKVKQLEAELGVGLFHRHSRGMTLTVAGAQLLPYADRIGGLLSEARRAAVDAPSAGGQLNIGSMETTAALRLPPILAAYTALFPAVDIVLQTGTSQSLIAGVVERRLEGALVAGPVDHADLVCVPVTDEELVLVTAPWITDLDAALEAPRSDTQAGLKVLVFRVGCSYRQRLETTLLGRKISHLRWLEFGTLEGIIGCVAAGIGVTLLPRAVVEGSVKSGKLAIYDVLGDASRVQTVFIRRRDAFVSFALSRFLECLTNEKQ